VRVAHQGRFFGKKIGSLLVVPRGHAENRRRQQALDHSTTMRKISCRSINCNGLPEFEVY
jgi:hypothetical protein